MKKLKILYKIVEPFLTMNKHYTEKYKKNQKTIHMLLFVF